MMATERRIHPDHARRLRDRLFDLTANATDLRTRAMVLLAWGGALRLNEVLSLDVGQVLTDASSAKLTPIRESAFLRETQVHSPGSFVITPPARAALASYLRDLIARGWLVLPAPTRPLFITIKGGGRGRVPSHERLGKRAAQLCFEQLQRRAGIRDRYRFADLRHDALMRFGKHGATIAQYGRIRDQRTVRRYLQVAPISLTQIAQLAAGEDK
jgi:integrase